LDGVLANDSDGDLDPLAAVLVSGPSHGALVLNADGSFTYEPAGDWYGNDSFTYKANDGFADSNVATVAIAVNPVNDAPVAADDAYTTAQNTQLAVAAPGVLDNDGDVDGDPLAAALVSGPSNGTLVLNADGSFTYDPAADWTGVDQFTYTAGDGSAESEIVTVTINVTSSSMTVSVAAIATGLVPAGQNTKGEVRVTLAPAIAGATVTGDWTFNGALLVAGTAGITDANGIAVIQSVPIKAKSGDVYVFTVTNVEAAGYVYDPAANAVSSAAIVMP
ncbi:MAG TPA: hypothetical protein DCM87_22140, partial [Planctomycetes bacterium]|nr:hypothetical protein [Planctomycetota bacterium]